MNSGRFRKGQIPWNKKSPLIKICVTCGNEFECSRKNPATKNCSRECGYKSLTGVPKSDEHKIKISENHAKPWLGKHNPMSSILAKKHLAPYQSGENHWNWKGGITPKLKSLRFTKDYREWVKLVFERDDYTCQICGKRGGTLQAHHHIESFAEIVFNDELEKLKNIDYGITLCVECHRKTDSYARRFSKCLNSTPEAP